MSRKKQNKIFQNFLRKRDRDKSCSVDEEVGGRDPQLQNSSNHQSQRHAQQRQGFSQKNYFIEIIFAQKTTEDRERPLYWEGSGPRQSCNFLLNLKIIIFQFFCNGTLFGDQ